MKLPKLYAILDWHVCKKENLDPGELVFQWFDAGIRFVQIRAKGISDLQYWHFAESIARQREAYPQALLTINHRLDIALGLGLNGIHCPSQSLPLNELRKLFPSAILIKSCHNIADVESIQEAQGATLSPLFSPLSKVDSRPTLEIEIFKNIQSASPIPIYALGGITPSRLPILGKGNIASLGYLVHKNAFDRAKRLLEALDSLD